MVVGRESRGMGTGGSGEEFVTCVQPKYDATVFADTTYKRSFPIYRWYQDR